MYVNCENQPIQEIENTTVVLLMNKENAIFSTFWLHVAMNTHTGANVSLMFPMYY